jgi:hypothetical protein
MQPSWCFSSVLDIIQQVQRVDSASFRNTHCCKFLFDWIYRGFGILFLLLHHLIHVALHQEGVCLLLFHMNALFSNIMRAVGVCL